MKWIKKRSETKTIYFLKRLVWKWNFIQKLLLSDKKNTRTENQHFLGLRERNPHNIDRIWKVVCAECGICSQTAWFGSPLYHLSSVDLSKSHNLSVPWFSHLSTVKTVATTTSYEDDMLIYVRNLEQFLIYKRCLMS